MTPAARAGLVRMASYWLNCIESWGEQFENYPKAPEEEAEINAALSYLGLGQIDTASPAIKD